LVSSRYKGATYKILRLFCENGCTKYLRHWQIEEGTRRKGLSNSSQRRKGKFGRDTRKRKYLRKKDRLKNMTNSKDSPKFSKRRKDNKGNEIWPSKGEGKKKMGRIMNYWY